MATGALDSSLLLRMRTRQLMLLAELGAQRNLGRAAAAMAISQPAANMAAVMPASLAEHYSRLGMLCVLPLALPLQVPSIHLITRRERILSPAAEDFKRQIAALAAP